jgi:hypothetical protein
MAFNSTNASFAHEALAASQHAVRVAVTTSTDPQTLTMTGVVISQPIPLSNADVRNFVGDLPAGAGAATPSNNIIGRFFFKVRLLAKGAFSPHEYLTDPCEMTTATDTTFDCISDLVALHTTAISVGGYNGARPKVGDQVEIELHKLTKGRSFWYNIQTATFKSILDGSVQSSPAARELSVECTSLAIMFEDEDREIVQPAAGRPVGGGADKSCVTSKKKHQGSAGSVSVKGSDYQTGTELHQNDWVSGHPTNPISNFILPIKPSESKSGTSHSLLASSGWFRLSKKKHGAIDISAKTGTPLYAVQDGTVTYAPASLCRSAGPSTGGNMLTMKTTEGYKVRYVHMDMPSKLKDGAKVKKGQIVGYVGDTGASQAEHLHWDVWDGDTKVNPADFYPKTWIILKGTQDPASVARRTGVPVHAPRKA